MIDTVREDLSSRPLEATGGSLGRGSWQRQRRASAKVPVVTANWGAGRKKACQMHLKEPRWKLKTGRWGWNMGKAETGNPGDGQEGLGTIIVT